MKHIDSIHSAIAQLEIHHESATLMKDIAKVLKREDIAQNAETPDNIAWQPGVSVSRLSRHVSAMECQFEYLVAHIKPALSSTAAMKKLKHRVNVVGSRLYYELWQASLSPEHQQLYNRLLQATGAKQVVWEGVPAPWREGASYKYIKMMDSGLYLFVHCCGFTFCEYTNGEAHTKAWSVPLEQVQLALTTATTNIETAVELLH